MERIVVIGGSFNPPTIAHQRLMEAAMASIDASGGVFVPTSHDYVARKMKRQKCPQDTLPDAMRFQMLESMCATDDRLSVSPIQMLKKARGYDFEMLQEVQAGFPDAQVCFVVGSDKLYVLSRWHRIDELLDKFVILVARRGEDDLEAILDARPYLRERWDRFRVFDIPTDVADVSSSAFRDLLRAGDHGARELVTNEVWEILDAGGRVPWHSICDFHDDRYRFLSNFFEAPVRYGGLTYKSTEAAFQAQKCMTEEERVPFTEYGPSKSKGMGRRVLLRPDWEEVKLPIMEDIVRAKFTQNTDLAQLLLGTSDKVLVEGNRWGDTFWGVDVRKGEGENHLGKILMRVRDELGRSPAATTTVDPIVSEGAIGAETQPT